MIREMIAAVGVGFAGSSHPTRTGGIAKVMPDVDVVVRVEVGYNEYEYRVALQNNQVTITGGRVISRRPTQLEMTNQYVWRREAADTTIQTRRVWDLCTSSVCSGSH